MYRNINRVIVGKEKGTNAPPICFLPKRFHCKFRVGILLRSCYNIKDQKTNRDERRALSSHYNRMSKIGRIVGVNE